MIQRNYSLPSCTLQVEGIVTGGDVLSILTNFVCRFSHHPEPIMGGLDLLTNLVKVTGAYSQALNSNTSLAIPEGLVQITPQGKHLHLLSVQLDDGNAPKPLQITLNTIQFFDLIEGLDRLCLDPLTLPQVALVTQTSEYKAQKALAGQAIPAIAGVFSVAISAAALYLIPVPKPDPKPVPSVPTQPQPLPTNSAPPKPSASPDVSPSGAATPEVTPETSPEMTAEPNPESSASPEPISTDTPSSN